MVVEAAGSGAHAGAGPRCASRHASPRAPPTAPHRDPTARQGTGAEAPGRSRLSVASTSFHPAGRIDALPRLPLKQEPGERFTYSLSVDVLGRLVEGVSGMPLDQFLRTRIFEPLGMRDTHFAMPAAKHDRRVALHMRRDGRLAPTHDAALGLHADYPARGLTYCSGGGGLSGTTADYARFLQLFLGGGELGGVRLLGRKTVELMLTNQIAATDSPFGLGFGLETPANDARSPLSVGSFERGGAFSTTYWADPQARLVALISTNTFDVPVELSGPFKATVYSALR